MPGLSASPLPARTPVVQSQPVLSPAPPNKPPKWASLPSPQQQPQQQEHGQQQPQREAYIDLSGRHQTVTEPEYDIFPGDVDESPPTRMQQQVLDPNQSAATEQPLNVHSGAQQPPVIADAVEDAAAAAAMAAAGAEMGSNAEDEAGQAVPRGSLKRVHWVPTVADQPAGRGPLKPRALQGRAHWRLRSQQVLLRFETSRWGRLRPVPARRQQRRLQLGADGTPDSVPP